MNNTILLIDDNMLDNAIVKTVYTMKDIVLSLLSMVLRP